LNSTVDANGNIPAPLDVAMTTLVGGLLAGAAGANAQGAATAAENETLNNWLNHLPPKPMSLSQADQYQQAVATGDASTQDKLAALSAQNDQNLAQACANGPSAGCQVQIQAAQAGGNVVTMKPLGNGQYFTYANPLSGMAGPENFPFSYASGPQITALPTGPSLGAATLDTMLGSPLAGAFGGLVYATGGSNASAYPVAQLGAATEGVMAGLAGFQMPEAPTFGAANTVVNPADLDTLAANGVKFTPQNVLATGTTPGGQVVFLETGSSSAGLQHIIEGHGVDFANQGIAQSDIPSVVMAAVTQGTVVGTNGSAPVYQISYGGSPKYIAVGVSSNGFIVRANPVSKWKPLQ
jgi:filamentous hemagglutinin